MVRQQKRQPRQRRPPENDGWEPPQQPDEPLPGLVPIGGGFYATNDEPVSPYDCVRWPDSPFCGGNPFTKDLADFGLKTILDECNIGIQFAPSFGFIKLPIHQFVYRKPGKCRLPPPPPAPPTNQAPACSPLKIKGTIEDNYLAIAYQDSYFEYREWNVIDWEIATANVEIAKVKFNNKGYFATVTFTIRWSYKFTAENIDISGTAYPEYAVITSYPIFSLSKISDPGEDNSDVLCKAALGAEFTNMLIERINFEGGWIACSERYNDVFTNTFDYLLPEPGNPPNIEFSSPIRSFSVEPDPPQGSIYGIEWIYRWQSLWIVNKQTSIKTFITDFDNPPPPPDDCECMCKCNNDSSNDQLLRLILKRIGPLPASVPNSLVKKNSGTRQIESLAQYIAYSVIQTNAQFGQFPQEIKIKDADLTQQGDQQQTVTMPNLAEAIAEIVGLLLVLRSESAANLVATVNAMIEAGSAKQSAILASDYGAANAEFLGYKGKQIEREVPFTFVPGEPQLDKMLKAGEVKVKGWDNADKNDLNDLIAPILEMAAMYRAANFRNVGTSSPLSKIKEILEGAAKLSDAVDNFAKTPPPPDPNNPDAPPPPPKKSDWDEFVESAESGFTSKPGITDNLHPYNRPLEQRPKIREFGTDTSENP